MTIAVNRAVARLLQSGIGPILGHSMVLLRYSAADGREIVLPVQAKGSATQLVGTGLSAGPGLQYSSIR